MMFLSCTYSFSFSWICASFSTTSSVLAIRSFCSDFTFWIISKVAGSEPSSSRHLWTFMGFSSSACNARAFVSSRSSVFVKWWISRFKLSTFVTCVFAAATSDFALRMSALSLLISFRRSWYCASPFWSVLCWILIFSYRSASSSLRRMSCAPKMSRSPSTPSSSFCWANRSCSASWIELSSFFSSVRWVSTMIMRFFTRFCAFSFDSFSFSLSFIKSFFLKCPRTTRWSFSRISSFNAVVW
mmetsp:Transcript_96653/g.189833  ORF Transcript_96653/g.189833 Transcript_96653/m.189833 type:complete len:242 (+) Transcript_96653:317-1042(+)